MKTELRHLLQPLVIPAVACVLSTPVVAAPRASGPKSSAPAARPAAKAAPPIAINAPAEAALLEVARQRGVNVLIDSTRINPSAPRHELDPATRGPESNLGSAVLSRAAEHYLSSERLNPNLFVFWAEPDQDKIAGAVLQGQGFGEEQGIVSNDQLLVSLRAQFDRQGLEQETAATLEKLARPLDGPQNVAEIKKLKAAPVPTVEGRLTDLPAGVQQQAVAAVIQESLRSNPEARNFSELWTRDEVWKRAHVWLRPADLRSGVEAALLVQVQVETPRNRFLVSLSPSDGSMASSIERTRFGGPAVAVTDAVKTGQLWVLPLSETDTQPPLVLDEVLLPAGSGFKARQLAQTKGADLGMEKSLETPVSLQATRRPLADFLRDAGQPAGVKLGLSPELEADSPLTSAWVQQMPLALLMQTVAHTYGATWAKEDANAYTLKGAGFSPLDLELLRVGSLPYFRFRDISQSAGVRQQAEFKAFAASVYDQAGDALEPKPGIAFTALPPEMQQELRQRAMTGMARRVLQPQIKVRDMLSGEWTFRLKGGFFPSSQGVNSLWSHPTLQVYINGKPRAGLTWQAPANTKAMTQMAQVALQPR